jgi:hypothetical protein
MRRTLGGAPAAIRPESREGRRLLTGHFAERFPCRPCESHVRFGPVFAIPMLQPLAGQRPPSLEPERPGQQSISTAPINSRTQRAFPMYYDRCVGQAAGLLLYGAEALAVPDESPRAAIRRRSTTTRSRAASLRAGLIFWFSARPRRRWTAGRSSPLGVSAGARWAEQAVRRPSRGRAGVLATVRDGAGLSRLRTAEAVRAGGSRSRWCRRCRLR